MFQLCFCIIKVSMYGYLFLFTFFIKVNNKKNIDFKVSLFPLSAKIPHQLSLNPLKDLSISLFLIIPHEIKRLSIFYPLEIFIK